MEDFADQIETNYLGAVIDDLVGWLSRNRDPSGVQRAALVRLVDKIDAALNSVEESEAPR
jgi:hypothetical protein